MGTATIIAASSKFVWEILKENRHEILSIRYLGIFFVTDLHALFRRLLNRQGH